MLNPKSRLSRSIKPSNVSMTGTACTELLKYGQISTPGKIKSDWGEIALHVHYARALLPERLCRCDKVRERPFLHAGQRGVAADFGRGVGNRVGHGNSQIRWSRRCDRHHARSYAGSGAGIADAGDQAVGSGP